MSDIFEKIISILQDVRKLIQLPGTDVAWSRYETVEDLIKDLDTYIEKLKMRDESILDDLILLLAPTCALHEISISSGWEDEYLKLANRFDDFIGSGK